MSLAILPGARRRWPTVLAAVVLAVTVGVATGEWLGWPFLAAPLQRGLSQALQRQVDLGSEAQPGAAALRVRFIGGLRLEAARLAVAAPDWSRAAHMLLANDVQLELRYIDLWRAWRGAPLRIARLQAGALDGELERLADGRASWQFGPPRATDPSALPPALPSFGQLQVTAGVLRYRDAPLGADLEARLSLASGPAADSLLKLAGSGTYRRLPVKIDLLATGPLPWVAGDTASVPVPVTLQATIGRARLSFAGRAEDALHLRGLTGRFQLAGPSLAAVGDPLGVTLPTTAAFRTEGALVKQGEVWRVVIDDATVGASRLNGAFSYDAGRRVPLLAGRLGGSKLMLADLGPVVGTTPAADTPAPASAGRNKAKVLPDRDFDLAALRAMDATVLVDIADVDLNTTLLEPLRPLRGHLRLAGGVLTLTELDARTAQGRLMGDVRLDGRAELALWKAELRWSGVRLERWIHQARAAGAPPYVSGTVDGRASLQGQGRSTAGILASLQGQVRGNLRDGAVSHLAVEAAGLDLAQSLGVLIKGDDALPVPCAVADLVATNGVLRPRVMVLDTRDSAIWVDGTLSLASEALDLRAVVVPKDFSPLTLRTPLHVGGTFAQPVVTLEKGPLGRKLAASFLLALVNPLAALIPLVDTGDADAARRGASACLDLKPRGATPAKATAP